MYKTINPVVNGYLREFSCHSKRIISQLLCRPGVLGPQKRLTQPSESSRQSGVEDCNADEARAEFSTQNFPWKEKSKAADVAGVCRPTDDGRRQRRRVIYSPEHAQTSTLQAAEGPAEYAEIRLGFCPLFRSQDRWRNACSCLNITFPVLCSSSRHPRAPPRAFSVRGPPPRKRASLGGNNCFAGMPTFGAVLSVRVRADESWE